MRNKISRTFWIVFLATLPVFFQNCSRAEFNLNEQSKTSAESNDVVENGTGYGGKVYVASLYWSNFCSDGTQMRSRFTTLSPSTASMDRDNCLSINAMVISLTGSDTSYHYSEKVENPFDLFVYQQYIFETAQPATPLIPTRVTHVCTGTSDASSGSLPVQLVMSETTVGAPIHTGTVSTVIGGVKREILMKNMSETVFSPTDKKMSGSDGTATYYFHIYHGSPPHAATAAYTDPSENLNMTLGCYFNF